MCPHRAGSENNPSDPRVRAVSQPSRNGKSAEGIYSSPSSSAGGSKGHNTSNHCHGPCCCNADDAVSHEPTPKPVEEFQEEEVKGAGLILSEVFSGHF